MFVFFSKILIALLEKIGPRAVTGQGAELNKMKMDVRQGFFFRCFGSPFVSVLR
jgi:hypothetical protein